MKTIIIDSSIQERLKACITGRRGFHTGLLLGRRLPDDSRDFICLSAAIHPAEDGATATHVADVSRKGVESHVLQVSRMMVAGLCVCGLYAVSAEEGKHAVEALHRLWLSFTSLKRKLSSITFLHLSSQSSQFLCRSGPPKGGELAAVELKFQQTVASKLVTYYSLINVALRFDIPPASTADEDVMEAEEAFFKSFFKAIKAQAVALDSAAIGIALPPPEESSRMKGLGSAAKEVEIYINVFEEALSQPIMKEDAYLPTSLSPSSLERREVELVGAICAVSCVHEKESEEDAIQALKEDFGQSLKDRITLLHDESATELEESEANDPPDPSSLGYAIHVGGSLALPRRVLLPLDPSPSTSSMIVADYLLPGEEQTDALGRFAETFDFPREPDHAQLIIPEKEGPLIHNGAIAKNRGGGGEKKGQVDEGRNSLIDASSGAKKAFSSRSSNSASLMIIVFAIGLMMMVLFAVAVVMKSS